MAEELAEALAEERARRKQSQTAAAAELTDLLPPGKRINQTRYQRWETGINDVDPDRDIVRALGEYLGMDRPELAELLLETRLRVKARRGRTR